VDIVSKNGALLLNIGPKSDGTIPESEEKILLEIGRWLETNGEAIYGTRPWKVYGEGPTKIVEGSMNDTKRSAFTGQDIRFTAKGDVLYATLLAWPEGDKLTIRSLASGSDLCRSEIKEVSLLGSKDPVVWQRNADGFEVKLPNAKPCDNAFVLRISPVDRVETKTK
jgi:alpha-L-fucosidase